MMQPSDVRNLESTEAMSIEDEIALCRETQDTAPTVKTNLIKHSATCDITKAGTDDPDCTCGLQEVLDDEAKDLAEENCPEDEGMELAEENQPDDETENCVEDESDD